jgi:polyhydroxyalkanoate synthesis regulator phasin
MDTDKVARVLDLLEALPKRGTETLKELFGSELNYDRADELAAMDPLPETQQGWLAEPPRILATAGRQPDQFHIIHVTLSDQAPQGRGFPLSITAERAVAQRLLTSHPYALYLFSDVDHRYWHFINLRDVRQSSPDGKGKLRRVLRRIAVGPDEQLRTAANRVAQIDVAEAGDVTLYGGITPSAIKDLHDKAFSVEAVTKEFFEEYVKVFDALRTQVQTYLPDGLDVWDYAQQFLNRVMFVYFVQRKGWLGNDRDFLESYWKAYQRADLRRDSFVSDWLNVLFFEAFNNRFQAGRADRQHLPEPFRQALQIAPYLNGGLFARNELDRAFADAGGSIDDELMCQVYDTFERYNFTIAEDTPLDQEVAVDPEMLGHVYESLVNRSDEPDARTKLGIHYTPRVEIDLMCRLALVERLANALGAQHRDLLYEAVFAYEPNEKEESDRHLAQEDLWAALDDTLESLTVGDPACGSGSFLVGMLHVLDDLRERADAALGRQSTTYVRRKGLATRLYGVDIKEWAIHVAELRLWLQLIIDAELADVQRVGGPILPRLSANLRTGDSLVQRVGDISLARDSLRLLAASADPSLQRAIQRLHDAKQSYYYADHRGSLTEEQLRGHEQELLRIVVNRRMELVDEEMRQAMAGAHDMFAGSFVEPTAQAAAARDRIQALERQHADLERQYRALDEPKTLPFAWEIAFAEVFASAAGGFGVVIGNPPYVRQERIDDPNGDRDVTDAEELARKRRYKEALAAVVAARWPRSFGGQNPPLSVGKRNDLYVYFYLVGLSLLGEGGAFCFITSNAWLDVGYGADLQEFLLTRGQVRLIIDNQVERSFPEADVNTIIALLTKPVDSAGALSDSLDHVARFVMCRVPFEVMLDPIPWQEIEGAHDRRSTPEFRVYAATQRWLREQGIDPEKQRYTGDKWGGKYLRAPDVYWTILQKAGDKLVRLGDIAEVKRGITTGANEFFYLRPTGQPAPEGLVHVCNGAGWEGCIEEEFLRPALRTLRECVGFYVDPDELSQHLLILHRPPGDLASLAAGQYVKWGTREGYHLRPSCRGRRLWYDLGHQDSFDAVLLRFRDQRNWTPVNRHPDLLAGDTVFIARFHRRSQALAQCAFMNSLFSIMCSEILGRVNLGEGLLTTYGPEIVQFPVLSDTALDVPTIQRLEAAFSIFESRPVRPIDRQVLDDAQAVLDRATLQILGVDPALRGELVDQTLKLVAERSAKAKSVS